jgi:FMN-dependent dehydrogenase
MIGRAYLWGLADNGQAGVENVLDILHGGIDSALLGLGPGGSAPACGRREQAKGAGACDGLAAPVRAELRVEVVNVGLDGAR